MSGPRLIGPRKSDEALAALADGQVIAVPGDGGYLLAARGGSDGSAAPLRARGHDATESGPLHVVVGRRDQAVALASVWTDETAHLTDRMWPGPLIVMVPARPGSGDGDPVVSLAMPATRALRGLCRDGEPLTVCRAAPTRWSAGRRSRRGRTPLQRSRGGADRRRWHLPRPGPDRRRLHGLATGGASCRCAPRELRRRGVDDGQSTPQVVRPEVAPGLLGGLSGPGPVTPASVSLQRQCHSSVSAPSAANVPVRPIPSSAQSRASVSGSKMLPQARLSPAVRQATMPRSGLPSRSNVTV